MIREKGFTTLRIEPAAPYGKPLPVINILDSFLFYT